MNSADTYADSVKPLASRWVYRDTNAINAPDGNTAEIYLDYGNGYLVLDMGNNEGIVDSEGADFTIFASGGDYSLSVGNELTSPFTNLGFYSGTISIDLASSNLEEARYVRVEYVGGTNVLVDAIQAIHYHSSGGDSSNPIIESIKDHSIRKSTQKLTLIWHVEDDTPWRYHIQVNGIPVINASWLGGDITFEYKFTGETQLVIVLTVVDVVNHTVQDEVKITIYDDTSTKRIDSFGIIFGSSGIGIIFTLLSFTFKFRYQQRKCKDHK